MLPTPSSQPFTEQDLFRSIFSSAGLGIAALDAEGVIMEANPALETLLGLAPGAAKGKSLFACADPRESGEYISSFRSFCEGRFDKFSLDGKFESSAGARTWLRITVTRLPQAAEGAPFVGVALVENVTGRRRAREKMQESEEKFRTLVSNLPGIAYRCANDPDWTMFYISEGVEQICGYPAADFIRSYKRSYASVIHPDDIAGVDAAVQEGLRSDRPFCMDYRLVHADGSIRWVQEKGRGVYSATGELAWLDGFIMDVTEQVESKRLLEEQRAQMVAASKLSALGQMSAGIAHEVNNPLAIIHGEAAILAELAREDRADQPRVQRAAERVAATALRISKIIKSLRAFARDGEQDPLATADLGQILEETAEFCRERMKNHGVDFRLIVEPGDLRFECRAVQISQVIVNLLNNAFDAVEEGPEQWIEARAYAEAEHVVLSISDGGPGIPAKARPLIMMPFFTTKEVGRGTGLGLSVSAGIAEAHQGSLTLDEASAPTRFVLRLPRRIRR